MKRDELLKLKIDGYIKDVDIYEDKNFSTLVPYYINKARHNLFMARLIDKISGDAGIKRALAIPSDFIAFDWVIVAGYYAMFHMATALLGIAGIRTRSHESLINALEYQYVYKKNLLKTDFIKKISEAKNLEEKYIERMWTAKSKRTIAHYRAEKEISRKDAVKVLNYSSEFIERLNEVVLQIREK